MSAPAAGLSRDDMRRIIAEEKGSVRFDGRIISDPSKIPTQAEIDAVRTRPPLNRLDNDPALLGRIQALEAQLAELRAEVKDLAKSKSK